MFVAKKERSFIRSFEERLDNFFLLLACIKKILKSTKVSIQYFLEISVIEKNLKKVANVEVFLSFNARKNGREFALALVSFPARAHLSFGPLN